MKFMNYLNPFRWAKVYWKILKEIEDADYGVSTVIGFLFICATLFPFLLWGFIKLNDSLFLGFAMSVTGLMSYILAALLVTTPFHPDYNYIFHEEPGEWEVMKETLIQLNRTPEFFVPFMSFLFTCLVQFLAQRSTAGIAIPSILLACSTIIMGILVVSDVRYELRRDIISEDMARVLRGEKPNANSPFIFISRDKDGKRKPIPYGSPIPEGWKKEEDTYEK